MISSQASGFRQHCGRARVEEEVTRGPVKKQKEGAMLDLKLQYAVKIVRSSRSQERAAKQMA